MLGEIHNLCLCVSWQYFKGKERSGLSRLEVNTQYNLINRDHGLRELWDGNQWSQPRPRDLRLTNYPPAKIYGVQDSRLSWHMICGPRITLRQTRTDHTLNTDHLPVNMTDDLWPHRSTSCQDVHIYFAIDQTAQNFMCHRSPSGERDM